MQNIGANATAKNREYGVKTIDDFSLRENEKKAIMEANENTMVRPAQRAFDKTVVFLKEIIQVLESNFD